MQNQNFEICYPPLDDNKLTAVDLSNSESIGDEDEEEAPVDGTEHSTSKRSKHDDDDEVSSKHTVSSDPRAEDVDSGAPLYVAPISMRAPKKPRIDAWGLDNVLDDDDSE